MDPPTQAIVSLFDHLENVLFWIKDREGRYCAVNRGILLNFALKSREEILGKTDFDIEPQPIAAQIRMDDERVLAGESILRRIELVGRFDRGSVWCVTSKVAFRDAQGTIIGTTGISHPLTSASSLAAECGDAAIARLLEQVCDRINEPMDNVAMARIAGLSLRAFERRFRQLFRASPQQHMRRLRIQLACRALCYSRKPISEIATDYGFFDQSHLGRELRRASGMTPSEYRGKPGGAAK